jgi:hypothetical protein
MLRTPEEVRNHAPVAMYAVDLPEDAAGHFEILIEALPGQPISSEHELICAISIDDQPPTIVQFAQSNDEMDTTWQQNALRSAMTARVRTQLAPGRRALKLWAADPSVVITRIRFELEKPAPIEAP